MPFARVSSIPRLAAAVLCATVGLATLSATGWGQEAPPAPGAPSTSQKPLPVLNYAKPVSHFPNPIGPYTPRHLSAPNLANTGRIDQLMHDGKLYLSLDDAIALALENNLDIAIARYNLNIADTDILRSKAGAAILGVPSGIVQNTPGGDVGGLGGQVGSGTGGTSLGTGGAGAGVGGLNGSTLGLGSQITSFDPIITGTLQNDRYHVLPSSTFSPASPQNTTTGNFAGGI
jgi:outer membrane protein